MYARGAGGDARCEVGRWTSTSMIAPAQAALPAVTPAGGGDGMDISFGADNVFQIDFGPMQPTTATFETAGQQGDAHAQEAVQRAGRLQAVQQNQEKSSKILRALLELLYCSGLRASELVSLPRQALAVLARVLHEARRGATARGDYLAVGLDPPERAVLCHADLADAVAEVESGYHPGVVGGAAGNMKRQVPRSL